MHTSKAIAKRFTDLDFHDDTFVSMTVLPSQIRNDIAGSVIEIRFLTHPDQPGRKLQFIGCANLQVGLDFDILADNLPMNTSGVDAHIDTHLMRELMQSQKHNWDIGYGRQRSPLDDKMEVMAELVCFRVQFFGGAVEIIAREFLIENIET